MKIAFAMVAFHSWSWFRVSLPSFRRHLPECWDDLFIVDANAANRRSDWSEACRQESLLLHREFGQFPKLLTLEEQSFWEQHYWTSSHGLSLDLAAITASNAGYTRLVLLEPDCLFLGRNWLGQLVNSVLQGNVIAGFETRVYGPLYPCGSIWPLPAFASFAAIRKSPEVEANPLYCRHVHLTTLTNAADLDWAQEWWDNGQLAWFEALQRGSVACLGDQPDFVHFGRGSERPPEECLTQPHGEHLSEYLRNGTQWHV